MKKKILALCLVVVLAITAVTGATLAYFTDKDAKTNTFTVGDVNIHIDEWKMDDQGNYTEYEDLTKLSPIAQTKAPFNKLVETVNDGSEDAYIRTFITCPAELWDELGYGFNKMGSVGSTGNVGQDNPRPNVTGNYTMHAIDNWYSLGKTTVDNEEVYIFVCEHHDAIPAGDSILSLTKIWIYDNVKNDAIGADFEVKVYSEAIQKENLNYEEAMTSLNGGKSVLEHAADLFNGN